MFAPEIKKSRVSQFPAGLFDREPGPVLTAFLKTADFSGLSGYELLEVLRAHQKMAAHHQAMMYKAMAEIAEFMFEEVEQDYEVAHEAAAFELRAGLRLTRRGADVELETAEDLFCRLPALGEALTGGVIDLKRARVMSYGTAHLDESVARAVVDQVLGDAARLTTGQLAARVRKMCVAVQPEQAKNRYEDAVEQRKVIREATVEGTANLLILDAPPERVAEVFNRLDYIAKSLHVPGETRTLDQIRTDIALDLLSGRIDSEKTGRGTINLHVDLETLARLREEPGDLAGFGPVIADIARQITSQQAESEWRYRVTDPNTGLPIHIGTTRRRPNAEQKRTVELRDLTCVFPGCRMPAVECDIDHIEMWEKTGRTDNARLGPGCRHDHVRRHKFGWTYQPLPGGDYLWTGLLGHTYTTSGRPPP